MSADRLPVSGLGYEDIPEQTARMEGARASGRTAFRESYLNSAVMEAAISSQVSEFLDSDPEARKQYDLSALRQDWRSGKKNVRQEDFVPRYSSGELAEMGFAVPEGFQFEDDGKMSLQRFSAYSQAYEDNGADADTVAAMPPGVLSGAASFGGGLAAGLADPINLIPFGAGISRVKQAFKAGKVSRAGIIGRNVTAGAAEGAAGAAVVDAVSFPLANDWGADLGLKEAMADIAVSGAFGSFFGALGGGLELYSHQKLAKSHMGALQKAVNDMERGASPDVEAAVKPVLDEARAALEARMADPEYIGGLLNQEQRVIDRDVDAFRREMADFDQGLFRESDKLSTAPAGPDGPRLILGESPPVFRMLDGQGWLEMSPDLARRVRLQEEWSGIDLAGLPRAMAQPAAVFDMGDGRRAALIALTDASGGIRAALAKMRPGVREFRGQKRAARPTDAFLEIDDITLISGLDLSTVGLARKIIGEGRPLYADAHRLAEISGVSRELTDAAVYAGREVRKPDDLNRHLVKEDVGIDLDSVALHKEIDLSAKMGQPQDLTGNANMRAAAAKGNQDAFGEAFTDFQGRPDEAVEHLLAVKRGHVPGAFYREELGNIDLPWGKGGSQGFGLAHIIERRNSDGYDGEAFARSLPRIIQEGRVEQRPKYPGRVFIVHDASEAIVRLEWDSDKKTWLLTAYPLDKKNRPSSSERTTDFAQTDADGKAPPPDLRSDNINIDELFEKDNAFSQETATPLTSMTGGDQAVSFKAGEMEIAAAERQLEAMATRGELELSEEEIDFLRNGSWGEGEDAVMGQRAEQETLTTAQAMVDGTECVIKGSLNVVS
ncbi:MAG: hypothetical protein LBV79_06765 [Candidatus Adiutrix sp.]|nr:hypothetical protein [Candidatus Adiutrix sp.]